MKLILILIVILLIFSGIFIFWPSNNSTKENCEKNGGIWHKWSFWQKSEECDMPYLDGGKVCNDSGECEGDCLFNETSVTNVKEYIGKESSGYCALFHSVSCVNHNYFIENGIVEEKICLE